MDIQDLTRSQVIQTAARFRQTRKIQKWTTVVEGRELPARPLVLEAAGALPNSTNSHRAVAVLEKLGFEVRYNGEPVGSAPQENSAETKNVAVVEAFQVLSKQVPVRDWQKVPANLSKRVDDYLYRNKKAD